jgi:hypothetical protein
MRFGKTILFLLALGSVALAQSFPTPTFNNVFVNSGTQTSSLKVPVALNVKNNTDLGALASNTVPSGFGVARLGYASAGDAPTVIYTAQSSCPYNGGAADGGACIATSDSKFWVADLPTILDLRIWGADITGASDSTSAVNKCLVIAANNGTGGQCYLPETGIIYLASSITLQPGSSIVCQSNNYGWPSNNLSGTIFNSMSQIRLASTATIHGNNSSRISGCMIAPQGMTFPQTSSASWTGTAIDLPGSTSHYNDFSLENLLVMGFGTCFNSTSTVVSRSKFKNLNLDCNSGLLQGTSDDNSDFYNIHVWPWATAAAVNAGTVAASVGFPRSGYGLQFTGTLQDGTHITGFSLSFGHTINLYIDAPSLNVESFWSDTPNGTSGAAYGVYVTSNASGFTADTIYTAGSGYGSNSIQAMSINAPFSQIGNLYLNGSVLTNCLSVGPTYASHVQIANLQITNCNIGSSGPVAAIGNNGVQLNVGSFDFTQGASGGTRTYDLSIPSGMVATQINMPHGYSDIGNAQINIGSNPLTYPTFTPTVTCSSGSITTLGTVTGKYNNLDNKSAWIYVEIPITTVGSCAGGVKFSTPFYFRQASVTITGRQNGVGGNALQCSTDGSASTITCYKYDNSSPAASGAILDISGVVPTQ